jgi:hypothetical protein
MEMGIERVLKENFAGFNKVVQVEDPEQAVTELSWELVEEEFNRIYPAIIAMVPVWRAATDLAFALSCYPLLQ